MSLVLIAEVQVRGCRHVAKLKDFNEKAIQEIQLLNVELKDSRTFQEAAAKQANEDFMLLREQINLHVQWVQTKHSASQVSCSVHCVPKVLHVD